MYKEILLEQGSPAWKAYRQGHIGASDAPIIMTLSPWTTPHQLWEYKLGLKDPSPMTPKMQRGVDLEPIARQICIEHHDINFIPKVFESIEHPFLCASLDGFSKEKNMILEIKCPNDDTHNLAILGHIKDYYMCQLQHQMMISGVDECLYMSYNPDHPNSVAYIDVYLDQQYVDMILKVEKYFWDCVCNIREFIPDFQINKYGV